MNAPDDMCFICGDMTHHLHESHHLVPRRLNGSDRDENVVNLCSNCHSALEKLYNTAFYRRLSEQLGLGYSLNNRGRKMRDQDIDGDLPPKESTGALLSDEEFWNLSLRDQLLYAYDHPEWFDNGLSCHLEASYNGGKLDDKTVDTVADGDGGTEQEDEGDLREMSIEERMIELGLYDEDGNPTSAPTTPVPKNQ